MAMLRLEDLHEQIESRRLAHRVPGIAVGVHHDNKSEIASFGIANIESNAPVTGDTVFQMGSVTKTFTASAILRLVEQGKAILDAPVYTYLPALRLSDETATKGVTLRHLLSHTSGLDRDWSVDCGTDDAVLARLTDRLNEVKVLVSPGRYFSYSNPGMLLAGRVLEVITGQLFTSALRTLLFEPLGLSSMFYATNDDFIPPRAAGHIITEGKVAIARPSDIGRMNPAAGGLCTNITDLLKWAQLHLCSGDLSGACILQPASFATMQTPAGESFPFRTWIGLPWGISDRDGARVIGHSGLTYGFVSTLELVPTRGAAIVILTNADSGVELMRDIRELLLQKFAGLTPQPTFAGSAINVPDSVLTDYAGQYGNQTAIFTVTPIGNSRLQIDTESRGFPRADSYRKFPPETWAFSAPDRVYQETPPAWQGDPRVFLRNADGRVEFMRGISLYPRL